MKQRNKVLYVTMLLSLCLVVTPAMGSMIKADHHTIIPIQTTTGDLVTIDFVDCTNIVPVKKEVSMPRTEWISIQNELRAIKSGLSVQDTLIAQLAVYKKHQLVSNEVTTEILLQKFNKKIDTSNTPTIARKMHTTPLNNTVFNAMSAIFFTLQNGTTGVLGLNTFINVIGFDIVSFHKGYASTDITTTGILGSRSAPPGNYVGAMFGFFGYWSGIKVKLGVYSNLTAAGFTVFTLWLPISA